MELKTLYKFEKAVILILNNFDGWQLEHTGSSRKCYDAIGLTPKGRKCIMEMKFRNKYYKDKMLEADKFNCMMNEDKDVVKIYFVSDPKGTYMYWLDGIEKKFETIKKFCPKSSNWAQGRLKKEVYLLPEDIASYIYKIN